MKLAIIYYITMAILFLVLYIKNLVGASLQEILFIVVLMAGSFLLFYFSKKGERNER